MRNGRQECCCLSRLIVTHEWEIFGSRLAHGEYSEYQRSTAVVLLVLTQYDNQADEYGPQCAHAQLQALPLLDELTVLAPVSLGTDAPIPETGLQIDAGGSIQAGQVQALVAIHTALGVRGHDATLAATEMEQSQFRVSFGRVITNSEAITELG